MGNKLKRQKGGVIRKATENEQATYNLGQILKLKQNGKMAS